jgi:hypothetical protein
MKRLKEDLQALVPTYKVNVAGQQLTLRFDVNINKTKKGVKLQFVLDQAPEDVREMQNLANEIGTELQKKFGDAGLQIIYDTENPYKNVIGFLLPLTSLGDYIAKNILKSNQSTQEPTPEKAQEPESDLPEKELAERVNLRKLLGI